MVIAPILSLLVAVNTAGVQARVVDNGWYVPAIVNGTSTELILSTSFAQSFVRRDLLDKSGQAEVTLAGKVLGRALAGDVPLGPIGGAIGVDLLKSGAVGFDLDTKEIRFWTEGVDSSSAEDWFRELPGSPKTIRLPIKLENGLPRVMVGENADICVQLSTSSPRASIISERSPGPVIKTGTFQERDKAVLGALQIGASKLPWWRVVLGEPAVYKKFGEDVVGILNIYDLPSRRVLIDFKGSSLYVEEASEDQAIAWLLSRVLTVPVKVEGGGIWLDTVRDPEILLQLDGRVLGQEIVQIGSLSSSEVVAALKSADAKRLEMMRSLEAEMSQDCVLQVQVDDGIFLLTVGPIE